VTLRQNVISGLRWTAAARAISQLFAWLGTIFVIRILSPDDYGIIAIGGFFILYLLLLSEGGLSDALVREKNLTDGVLHEVQGILLAINSFCCLALIAASPFIANYFDEPRLRQVLPVFAIQFLIISVGVIPQAQLTREMRFKELSTISISQAAFTSATTLIFALLGFGVWSLVISNLAGLTLKSVMLLNGTRKFYRPVFRFKEARIFTAFSGYVLLDRTVWHFLANIDALLVGKLLGTTATGTYAVAQNLASIPISKVAGVLSQVALPAFSHIQDQKERVQGSYVLALRCVAMLAFPVGFGLAAVAVPLLDLVLGDKWKGVQLVFQILAFSIPFRLMSSFDSPLLLALGLPKVLLQNRIISLILLVIGLILASRWGLVGVAIAWSTSAPVIWLLTSARFCRILGWSAWSVLSVALVPFLAATVMFLSITALQRLPMFGQIPSIVSLAVVIPCGAAMYAGALFLIQKNQFLEAVAMVRGVLTKRTPSTTLSTSESQ
jgi:O-antigen/teichoic acid export membrane protein